MVGQTPLPPEQTARFRGAGLLGSAVLARHPVDEEGSVSSSPPSPLRSAPQTPARPKGRAVGLFSQAEEHGALSSCVACRSRGSDRLSRASALELGINLFSARAGALRDDGRRLGVLPVLPPTTTVAVALGEADVRLGAVKAAPGGRPPRLGLR